jgi:hypothetical protein
MTDSGLGPPRARSKLGKSCLAFALPVAFAIADASLAQEFHSNPWLLSWIPATCCVTNDCCWEVSERELRPLADDRWEVVSTGQVRKRTDWSPDGRFYRCACDYVETRWVKHQGAYTRCLFVPLRSASR